MTNHQPSDPATDETSHVTIPATHSECANPVEAALWRALREARRERDQDREKIERIMDGLEGCCMTCEPVGARNQQMQRDIEDGIEEITKLRRRCDVEASHIAELKDQIRSLRALLAVALEQRDEARREVCWRYTSTLSSQHLFAKDRGWDCFRQEDTK